MKIDVDVANVSGYKADERGRITLGSEYKNKKVVVAVVEEVS